MNIIKKREKKVRSSLYTEYRNTLRAVRIRKWKLIYKEKYNSKKEEISREYYINNNRTFRNKIKNKYYSTNTE